MESVEPLSVEPLSVEPLSVEEQLLKPSIQEHLYKVACQLINSKPMTPALIISILTRLMIEVEVFYTLGYQKKIIVLHIISRIINNIPSTNQYKISIQNTILLFGSIFIDTIVSTSKGQISLNINIPLRSNYKSICCMLI